MKTAFRLFVLPRTAKSFSGTDLNLAAATRKRPFGMRSWSVMAVAIAFARLSNAGNENWDPRFGAPSLYGVSVVTVGGSNVYVGGSFGIRKWNPVDGWSNLGTSAGVGGGADNAVHAIAVSGNGDVYVGGRFQTAFNSDGSLVAVNNFAKWNGNVWSAVGDGVGFYGEPYARVYAIAISGNDVYVGGTFTNAGSVSVKNLARWSTAGGWSALGGGVTGYIYPSAKVRAILVSGSDVYVGGSFTNAGGVNANNIAKLTGGTWSAFGSGVGYAGYPYQGVYAIGVSGGDVYAGGDFDQGSGPHYLARWSGSSWDSVGGGLAGSVTTIAVSGTSLYVGDYSMARRWDGANWSNVGSGVQGGGISSLAITGNTLFLAGSFTMAGGVPAAGIARTTLPATGWSAVGGGLNGDVKAIAAHRRALYMGGSLTQAGSTSVNHIAKWDGTNWSALGGGLGSAVNAIAFSGDDIYGGANGIYRWNGSTWSPLGGNVNGQVNAISIAPDGIYIGGVFTTAGGTSVSNIARWDGTNWSALGGGPGGWVYAIEGTLAGGSFGLSAWSGANWIPAGGTALDGVVLQIAISGGNTYIGGSLRNRYCCDPFCEFFCYNYNFFKWDGSAWSYPGFGGSSDAVTAMKVRGSHVYLGGAGTISRWDGSTTVTLGAATGGPVNALEFLGADLYVGGSFTNLAGTNVSRIARLDTSSWSALEDGLNGDATTIAVRGNNVYVAGSFTSAGALGGLRGLAQWDGHVWSPIGQGLDGVLALAVSGSDIYAGTVSGVFKCDGNRWSGLPGPAVNGSVLAVAVSGADIYVGGVFTMAGGIDVNHIARWNGSNWSRLGSGVSGTVRAIAVSGTNVYAGGEFTAAGGNQANYVARWDGSNWWPLAGGVGGAVNALAAGETNLYAGGNGGVLKWDGRNWSALGQGVQETVNALAVNGGDVYVGGRFNRAYNANGTAIQVNKIARWDGSSWSALGTGVDPGTFTNVWAVAVGGTNVYLGGSFRKAGGKPSSHFARWTGATFTPPRLTGIQATGPTNTVIRFLPTPGLPHDVQATDALGTGTWFPAATDITGLGGVIQVRDSSASTSQKRFYRIHTGY